MIPARFRDRPILWRLLQLYLHDFSEVDRHTLNARGEFEYRWFDRYWSDPERTPLLVRVEGKWAGFALVRLGEPNEMAEFFVMRKYRRSGIGRRVAAECFRRFPGNWRIHEVRGNAAAVAFWRAVIPVPFDETSNSTGTAQTFEIPQSSRLTTRSGRSGRASP